MSRSPSLESVNFDECDLEWLSTENEWATIESADIPAQEPVENLIPADQTESTPKLKPQLAPSEEMSLCSIVTIIVLIVSGVIATGIYTIHTFA